MARRLVRDTRGRRRESHRRSCRGVASVVSSHCVSPERAHDPRGIPDGPEMTRNVSSVDRWDGNKRYARPEAPGQNEELGLELVPVAARPDFGDETRPDRAETTL